MNASGGRLPPPPPTAPQIEPDPWEKFLYIAGKRAAPRHRAWLGCFLRDTEPRKLGAILAMPNSLMMLGFAVLWLAISDPGFATVWILLAAAGPVMGALFSPRRRVAHLARKNNLSAADHF